MNVLPTPEALALEFSRVLRAWLTEAEMKIVNERNDAYRTEGKNDICASHEFCDANMAMAGAFEFFGIDPLRHGYTEEDGMSTEVLDLWNEAWEIAVRNHFKTEGSTG